MAVLSDSDRQIAAREWIKKTFVELGGTATLTTTQIKAAIDAADDWVDTNAAAFNTALPATFRNTATAAQKNLLICYVCLKRAGLI